MNFRAGSRVIAPDRYTAICAAPEDLAFSAGTGQRRLHRLSLQEFNLRCFDEGIDGEGRAGFALAPSAVAAMDEYRSIFEAVAHGPAGAAAFDRNMLFIVHLRRFSGTFVV
jgi:hypothetical protein